MRFAPYCWPGSRRRATTRIGRVEQHSRDRGDCMHRGVAILALAALAAGPAQAARIESFSPRGVAKNVRQVAARFSEPIVPLGDPRSLRDPFAIECSAKGRARWADGRTWIYTFDENLPAGVRCVFTVRTELRTLA